MHHHNLAMMQVLTVFIQIILWINASWVSQVWWHTPLISVLRRPVNLSWVPGQHTLQDQPRLHGDILFQQKQTNKKNKTKKKHMRASEMAPQVPSNPEDLNSIPWSHMVVTNWCPKLILWFPCASLSYTHTCTQWINNKLL